MKTIDDLRKEMRESGLDAYFDALAPLAKNALRVTLDVQDDEDLPVGVSKFGGCPDLPTGVEWFRTESGYPISFIAQINFAEAVPYDLEHKLPTHGMLYFFYDGDYDALLSNTQSWDWVGHQVLFYDGDAASLTRREPPEDLEDTEMGTLYGAARMCFESVMELPTLASDLTKNLVLPGDDDWHIQYWDWFAHMQPNRSNKLLGHADTMDTGMELMCEFFANQLAYTFDNDDIVRSMGLDKHLPRWNLLLQMDSNDKLGMMWSDMGRLYLWITSEDLAARNFKNIWVFRQSC